MREKKKNEETLEKNDKKVESVKERKIKKSWLVVLAVAIVGLILLFTLTSYKMLFSPKKMAFLSNVTKDVTMLGDVIKSIEEHEIINLISNKSTKNLNFDVELNTKKISGEGIFDSEYVALKLNDITDNYLLLENKKLDEFLDKLGITMSGSPSEINLKNNPISLTVGEKVKLFYFVNNCTTDILTNLGKEKITLNKEVNLKLNDENLMLNSVEVQLSESDMFMLQKEALTHLQDDGILNMLINKINKISTAEKVDKKEVKAEIEKYIAYLDYAKAYYDLEDKEDEYYIIYRMYYDAAGVVSREIIEKYTYEGKMYEDIICSLVTNPDGYYEVKWFTQEEYSSAYYNIISDKITTTDNVQNHEIKYAVEGFYVGTAEGEEDYQYVPVNAEMTYNLIIETLENGETKLELLDPNNLYKFNLNYTNDSANLEFATKYNELNIATKLSLTTTNTTKEELINNGAFLINDKEQEDLMIEFSKIGSKLSEIFVEPEIE